MQRRLVNALQDMVIENDGTVRNSDKNIIQFKFGDDSVNPQHTDHGAAVNLDVLLLKAKTLDLDEIKHKGQKSGETKSKKPTTKTTPSIKPSIKKTTPKPTIKKSTKAPDEDSLQQKFKEETGKNAVWRGKTTQQYLEWKEQNYGIKE